LQYTEQNKEVTMIQRVTVINNKTR
jgi:hypothetical protein